MKHNLLSLFFATIVAMNASAADVWDGSSDIFTHGAGTEQSPYLIENAEQLAFIAEMVNAGVYTYSGNYFKLTTDLNLNYLEWTPIGDATNKFGGNFDGGGHTISNLRISAATANAGLFGVVTGGKYKKITVQGTIVSSTQATNAGGLIAYATAACTIDSCTNMVYISEQNDCVGGIIGRGVNVSCSNCINNTGLCGKTYVGGIIGYASNTVTTQIKNCINKGAITAVKTTTKAAKSYAGGIIGQGNNITLFNLTNFGSVKGEKSAVLSSELGKWHIGNCNSCEDNKCEINIQTYLGGVVGNISNSVINSCCNYATITGISKISGTYIYSYYKNSYVQGSTFYPAESPLSVYYLTNICCVGGCCGEVSNSEMKNVSNLGNITSDYNIVNCPYSVREGVLWYENLGYSVDRNLNKIQGDFEKHVNTLSVTRKNYIGGILGNASGVNAYLCMNKGVISGQSTGSGIMDNTANCQVSYCANTGNVSFAGISSNASVYCSYSASSTGTIGISSGTVTNSYYINGSGNGTQKTDVQMKSVSMPILLNTDSTVFIQDIKPNVNKGYPIFKNGMKYIATNEASDESYTSATIHGNYYNCTPSSMGFEYKKSSASSYSSKTITNASPSQYALTNLTQGTTYDVRYWLVDNGIKYVGEVVQFTTLACPTKPVRSDTVTLCQGESYRFAGKTLTQAGTYRDSLIATTGCDSVIELVLKVTDTYKYPRTETINRGESYDFYGQLLTEPGVYNEYIRTTNRCNWIELTLIVHELDKTLTLNVNNPLWGSVIGAGTFEHGTVAEFSALPAEGCYFVNWSDGETSSVRTISMVKDTIITANFAIRQYTITTLAPNGTVTGGGIYNYGTQVTLTATADEHYHFVRWNDGNTEATRQITVTENKTYSAVFELDKFLVTFRNDDGTVLKSEEVEYGVMPFAPIDPTKESTAQYDYTFAGWTPTIAIVTQAATYTATYTPVLREYLVTFLNEDNTVISSKNYKYGETPVVPADPVKQNTAEYIYSFNGWDNAIAQVQGPQTYKATYTATKNSYTITWQNEDGSLIDQAAVEYGIVPTHAEPTKQATAEYTYTFAGWTPIVVAVTGNATYRATFSATKNKYLITFRNDDGTVLKSEEVEYGMLPIAPATPTKESTAQYNYEFAGWTPSVTLVNQAATYTATYNSSVREYLVTFLNDDNSIISVQSCKYGSYPTIPSTPTKNATAEFSYSFAGWTPNLAAVSGDVTYKATFTATKNSYTITWQNEDGSLIDQTTVEYGVVPTHADPIKTNTTEYTYTFAGWTPAVVAVTGNATYRATFSSELNTYTLTFEVKEHPTMSYSVDNVPYGTIVSTLVEEVQATLGTTFEEGNYIYTFAGLEDVISTDIVSEDKTYYVLYTKEEKIPLALDNVNDIMPAQKILINDLIFILRGDKTYTLQGQEVK